MFPPMWKCEILPPKTRVPHSKKWKKNKSHTGGKISHFHTRIRWGSVKIKCPLNGEGVKGWWRVKIQPFTLKDTVPLLYLLFYLTILKEKIKGEGVKGWKGNWVEK